MLYHLFDLKPPIDDAIQHAMDKVLAREAYPLEAILIINV